MRCDWKKLKLKGWSETILGTKNAGKGSKIKTGLRRYDSACMTDRHVNVGICRRTIYPSLFGKMEPVGLGDVRCEFRDRGSDGGLALGSCAWSESRGAV